MGNEWLNRVITALTGAYLWAIEGYPAGNRSHLTEPVAAVTLERVDHGENSVTVGVEIFSPAGLGGSACRTAAEQAGAAIAALGMACVQEAMDFHSALDCYRICLKATYTQKAAPAFTVELDGETLSNVASVSVRRDEDAEQAVTFPDAYWYISMEEVFGPEDPEPVVTAESFSLKVTRPKSVETYEGCSWSSIHREHSGTELRRVRTAKSATRNMVAVQ